MDEDETLRQRVEQARAALKRIRRGEGPTAEELAAAPQLECWHLTKENGCVALGGYVTGHPSLPDGYIVTSCLLWLSDDGHSARTVSRFYCLKDSLEEIVAQTQ